MLQNISFRFRFIISRLLSLTRRLVSEWTNFINSSLERSIGFWKRWVSMKIKLWAIYIHLNIAALPKWTYARFWVPCSNGPKFLGKDKRMDDQPKPQYIMGSDAGDDSERQTAIHGSATLQCNEAPQYHKFEWSFGRAPGDAGSESHKAIHWSARRRFKGASAWVVLPSRADRAYRNH